MSCKILKKIRINIGWRLRQLYQYLFYKLEWLISEERKDPYRCCDCGSTDLEHKAWIKINEGGKYVDDCDEEDACYCNNCCERVRIHSTSDMLAEVNKWWGEADSTTMERVTGLRLSDFLTENGPQKFADACNQRWKSLAVDHKVDILRELQFWQDQEE